MIKVLSGLLVLVGILLMGAEAPTIKGQLYTSGAGVFLSLVGLAIGSRTDLKEKS